MVSIPATLEQTGMINRPNLGNLAIYVSGIKQFIRTVPIFDTTLLLVEKGIKSLHHGESQKDIPAGSALLLTAGQKINISNCPDPDSGQYRALALSFAAKILPTHRSSFNVSSLALDIAPAWQIIPADFVQSDGFKTTFNHGVAGLACPLPIACSISDRVRQLVAQAPEQAWSLATVAKEIALSEATLRRRLAENGVSFRDILTETRLSQGLNLLQTSRESIAAVALACGYESPSRFSERFRQRFGVTPSNLRGEQKDCAVEA